MQCVVQVCLRYPPLTSTSADLEKVIERHVLLAARGLAAAVLLADEGLELRDRMRAADVDRLFPYSACQRGPWWINLAYSVRRIEKS